MSLDKKLKRDKALKEKYVTGMQELLMKGYATEVPKSDLERSDGKVWYLPHHPVISANKPKPRIVFDCAAQHHGASLNAKVLSGPDLTNKLIGVLLRFRLHPIAMMADVEAMFHQVKVPESDRDVLRFLWWLGGDTSKAPTTYRMTVHLFGGTWSPSCCTFALLQTAMDNESQYLKTVSDTVRKNFYVDDCLKSTATIEEAVELARDLKGMLSKGGFNLTKWTSNRQEVLAAVPQDQRSKQAMARDIENPLVERALGVYWDVESDSFGYKVTADGQAADQERDLEYAKLGIRSSGPSEPVHPTCSAHCSRTVPNQTRIGRASWP